MVSAIFCMSSRRLIDGAEAVGGVEQLVGQALGHRLLAAGTAEVDEPADGQRVARRGRTSTGTW